MSISKDCWVGFRVSNDELETLRETCDRYGMTMSQYLRSVSLGSHKSLVDSRIESLERRYSELLFRFSELKCRTE